MCTFNITVDESKLALNYPGVDREKFGQWLQQWVDDMMTDVHVSSSRVSPNTYTYEEMKLALRERIDCIESGQATFHTNDEVFSSIRERYGL